MSLTDLAQGEVRTPPHPRRQHGSGALTAGIGALFAAVSGLLLSCGVGLVLWAVTPSSIGGSQQALRAAVAAFAAGNGMTLDIGRASLTLPPLMLTAIAVALLAAIGGRGRSAADDRTGELSRTVTAAAVYAAAVTTAGVTLGTPGAVAAEQWWRPGLLGLVVVGMAVFFRGQAWRSLVLERSPSWFPVAVRLGAVGALGVLAAGAAALVVGLVSSFGSAGVVQTLAAPGPAAGFGMALLSIAYLPNAAIAAAGYATGAGFHIGGGTYSPFGSAPVELPAVSLLAAAPDGRDASRVGIVLLLLPVIVALLIGRAAVRRLPSRRDRLLAVGTGAAISGLLVALLAGVARGGVTGGQWADIGAPPLLFGVATALILGIFGAAVAGAARAVAAPAAEGESDTDTLDASDGAEDPPSGPAADEPDTAADEPDTAADDSDSAVGGPDVSATADGADIDPDTAQATAEPEADAVTSQGEVHPAGPEPDCQVIASEASVEPAVDSADLGAAHRPPPDASGAGTLPDGAGASTVPQARREEDVLADSTASPDADLVDHLRPRPQPRQVG